MLLEVNFSSADRIQVESLSGLTEISLVLKASKLTTASLQKSEVHFSHKPPIILYTTDQIYVLDKSKCLFRQQR